DDLVARAGRAALQLQIGNGTLDELESVLLPLALAGSRRPIYRKLVVELYDALTAPLVQASREGEAEAQAELARLGVRAIKPLLEALADPDPAQHSIAVEVLGHLQNPNAAAPLLAVAQGTGPTPLRMRALESAVALVDGSHVSALIELSGGAEARLRTSAVWGLARIRDRRSVVHLRTQLQSGDLTIVAYALVGLGAAEDRTSRDSVRRMVDSTRHPVVRAAALWALGRLGGAEDLQRIRLQLGHRNTLVAQGAMLALGSGEALASEPEALSALAESLFASDAVQRQTAARAMRGDWPADPIARRPGVTLERTVAGLFERDGGRGPLRDGAAAAIAEAGRTALRGPIERVSSVVERIREGRVTLGGLETETDLGALAAGWITELAALTDHPSARLRAAVARALAGFRAVPAAADALGRLLEDDDTGVQLAALEGARGVPTLEPALVGLLADAALWSLRVGAAEALEGAGSEAGVAALRIAAVEDDYAFVRAAAVRSLHRVAAARGLLEAVSQNDPDRGVREAASAALEH
ncbi:MAG: hypothetical protein AAF645_29585, partial [Myxococcota bacterium]